MDEYYVEFPAQVYKVTARGGRVLMEPTTTYPADELVSLVGGHKLSVSIVQPAVELIPGGNCPKGGNHEWGTDGVHNNPAHCHKCFCDQPPGCTCGYDPENDEQPCDVCKGAFK